jgi:4-amino-4-deoxy-L-arabinose transferase-like glycosyltransferase
LTPNVSPEQSKGLYDSLVEDFGMDNLATHIPGKFAAALRGPAPVLVLLACHAALGLTAVGRKSPTFDEGIHVTAGLSYWMANDYRLHPENGNWTQRWVAWPIWLGGYHLPRWEGCAWQQSDVRTIDQRFFFELGNDADAMLWRGRLAMTVPSVALAVLVYLWSRSLFGPWGGLVSLTLYAFSPTMLAHGFLTTSDMGAALFLTAATWAQWNLLHRVSPLSIAVACVAVAGLLLSKLSGVIVIPICLLLVGVRLLNPEPLRATLHRSYEVLGRWRQLVVLVAAALAETLGVAAIIWASYGFRYSAFAPGQGAGQFEIAWEDVEAGSSSRAGDVVQFARDHHLLPEAYLYGMAQLMSTQQRSGFFHGEFGWDGWAMFFPCCLALKTPVALFLLLALAGLPAAIDLDRATVGDRRRIQPGGRLYATAPLLVLLVVYWAFALGSNINIGHRHILPSYPALFILAGAAGLWFQSPPSRIAKQTLSQPAENTAPGTAAMRARGLLVARALVTATLVFNVVDAIWIWPDYLAYFNQLAGGPRHGYRWLVDSSLDWGQGLKELKAWLDNHPDDAHDPRRVYLSYFGVVPCDYYGIRAENLPGKGISLRPRVPRRLTGGLYCVSATMLQVVYLRPRGRWNETYEKLYQEGRRFVAPYEEDARELEAPQLTGAEPTSPELLQAFQLFEELRLARLCSFLRSREPDDQVGYSILIYRLTDDEVAKALAGPPGELLPKPEA